MDFQAFPKIPRLNREIVVTEKLDGTNAAILVEPWDGIDDGDCALARVDDGRVSEWYRVQAQSRKRLIEPNSETKKGVDNHGFAGWVFANAEALVCLLGPGRHFGEWWGQGIQGRYGQHPRTFSLFNVERYAGVAVGHDVGGVRVNVVPELYRGPFDEGEIRQAVADLAIHGSVAAPGSKAEGVIVFHTAAGQLFKVTCENDEVPKEVAAREAAKVQANGQGKVASIHWGGDGL